MEGIGPEPKRQRLEYNGSRALPPQPPPPPQSHSHNNSTLPPPHSYPPPQQPPPPPPSPYEVAPHDQRSLPDPTPHAYVQEHSGHSTPIREQRFHPDSTFSRRNSGSAVARSPDGHHQYAPVRSMTSATAAEGQHFPPPQQHQYPADPGGHVPYASHDPPPNGSIHHGLPMHPYDQTHGFPQPHLEYTHSPVTAGPNPYGSVGYGVSYSQAGTRPLKKGNRATQACDVCRTRKAKCDEGRPECGFCVDNNMRCNYQSVAPAKADRANQQIIDQLSAHKEDMRALKEDWGGRFDRIEQLLENIGAGKSLSAENQDVKPSLKVETPPRRSNGDAKMAPVNTGSRINTMDPPAVDESPTDSASNDAAATQNNAIYVEHDTAAQKLFRWRSIKALLKQAGLSPSDRTEEYVMSLEMNKGVLRYYGKGRQLRDSIPMSQSQASGSAASPAPSPSSGPGSEVASSTGSPASPPENLWGTAFIPTISELRPISDAGGLNSDNTLKLDPKTVNRLVKSYLNNIHILHPFLREGELTRLAEQFKQRYNPQDPNTSKASFAVPVAIDNLRGPKRKHSEGLFYNAPNEPSLAPSPISLKILLERSPDTAIMLLVMALGRIAECREPLPGPVPDNVKDNVSTLTRPYSPVRNQTGSPPASYPMRQSPSSSSHTTTNTSAPSPMSVNRIPNSSPRSSVGEPPVARNVDVIPGLAYYAQATDILGNLTGYHELVNAQCCLLAGLYAGQLANSLESLTWIQAASRICRFLVKEPAFKTVREPKKELIKLAFWSSLQLESDILAELDIPPSGIQDVNDVPYPKGTMDQGDFVHGETDRPAVMIYYSFQLHMRKLLNDIQKELYQEKDANFKRATRATSLSNAFNTMINEWKARLPEQLQWEDHDPPADNINDARLRGKFYGAQYIIHRPFLHAALDYDFDASDIHSPPGDNPIGLQTQVPLHSAPAPTPAPAMGPPAPIGDPVRRREETINLARRCIQAAVQSTVAFDGVLDHRRMVVTNIMGTAHAQFGNILVLSAAYKSRILGTYVPKPTLERLFDRTIRLLGHCGPISETLKKDCAILESLRKAVFESEAADYSNSFSSE